ncbi:MAG TPA: hypothetical protein VED01_15495 [Burkholderiales bacterium]|nr:hypothetical protein [Burkholderiales bacterium]
MNDETQTQESMIATICAAILLFGAVYWTTYSRAQVSPAPQRAAVSAPAFEYYPAQFTNQAADYSDPIPTF